MLAEISMTPLRQRFIEDLQLRNRSPKTIEAYFFHLKEFVRYFGQAPDQLGAEQVHRYLLYLLQEKKASWAQYNQAVSALRFFYRVTCPKDMVVSRLPYGKRPKRLMPVRARAEVARFLAGARSPVVAMLLRTIYATGLRLAEALALTAENIDSQRLLLRVLGKGQKERVIPLSPQLLAELRAYWLKVRPQRWLFPGKDKRRQFCASSVQRACQKICREQGLPRITPHTPCLSFVRQPALSLLWRQQACGLAGAAAGRVVTGAVLSCGVHPAASAQCLALRQPRAPVSAAVRRGGADAPAGRGGPQALRGPYRRGGGAAHLGAAIGAPPPPPLRGAWRRAGAGHGDSSTRRRIHRFRRGPAAPLAGRPNFFLPVQVLGRVFRGKYRAGLRHAYAAGTLHFAGSTAALAKPNAWRAFLRGLDALNFVVYAKEPFGGPEQVLKYLTQYTHRVAISNARLVQLHDEEVTFTWKDYAHGCQRKQLSLAALEFVRRFALHILPKGLVRIRQYGLLANRGRRARLAQCRALLEAQARAAGAAPAPSRSYAWLGPCLLAGLLLLALADGNAESAPSPADLLAAFHAAAQRCPACGVGELTTLWQAQRPTARQLERRWQWDTS
jgi:site-specific recombinase XerD